MYPVPKQRLHLGAGSGAETESVLRASPEKGFSGRGAEDEGCSSIKDYSMLLRQDAKSLPHSSQELFCSALSFSFLCLISTQIFSFTAETISLSLVPLLLRVFEDVDAFDNNTQRIVKRVPSSADRIEVVVLDHSVREFVRFPALVSVFKICLQKDALNRFDVPIREFLPCRRYSHLKFSYSSTYGSGLLAARI